MAPSRSRRIRWMLLGVLGLVVMLVVVPLALPRYPAVDLRGAPDLACDRTERRRAQAYWRANDGPAAKR